MLAWAVGVGVTALACGTFVDSVGDMVADNPEIAQMIGDASDLVGGFVAVMALFLGLGAGGFAVASAQRARGEETAGGSSRCSRRASGACGGSRASSS